MSYASEVLADSPLLAWSLDETTGTAAADASGNGRTGTYSGSPTLNSRTVFGLAAPDFANLKYVEADANISVGSTFSMECIFHRDAHLAGQTGNINSLIGNLTSTSNGALLRWDNSTSTLTAYIARGAAYSTLTGTTALTSDTHVVLTVNGTSAKLYINGVMTSTTLAATASGFNHKVRVASSEGARYMDGAVAWFSVYDTELTAGDVAARWTVLNPATLTASWGGWAAAAAFTPTTYADLDAAWGSWTAEGEFTTGSVDDAVLDASWGSWSATMAAFPEVSAVFDAAWGTWTAAAAFDFVPPEPIILIAPTIETDITVSGGTLGVLFSRRTQTLTRTSTGGTVTLTFSGQTTVTIPATAAGFTATAVQAALEGLSNVAPGDVEVEGAAGGPLTVTFGGTYAGTLAYTISVDVSLATGGTVTAAVEVPELEFHIYNSAGIFQGVIDEWLDGSGFEVVHNDAGGGTLNVAFDNPTADLVDLGDIVRCWYRGIPVYQWVVDEFDHDTIPADGSEGFKSFSGSGLIAALNHARVQPSRGFGAKPVEDVRPFGWTSATYSGDFFWASAVEIAQQGITAETWLDFHTIPAAWPDPSAWWIWGEGGTVGGAPVGPCYFHYRWDAPTDLNVRLFAAIDNTGWLYLDGQKVLDADGFVEASTVDVTISAGVAHSFAVYAENYPDDGMPGGNPAGVLIAAYEVNQDGTLGQLLFHTDSDWRVVAYPPNPPGTTWGEVLMDLMGEAQDRGLLAAWSWDFAWPTDSNGTPFSLVWDPSSPVGADYWAVIQQAIAAGDIDVRLSPAGHVLHVYEGGTAGVSTGVSLTVATDVDDPTSGNLLLLRHRGQAVVANVALIRWAQGWYRLDLSDTDDPIEITLELGSVDDLSEAIRIATVVLESMGERVEVQVDVEVRDGEVPFDDYLTGDLVSVPDLDLVDGEQRVVAIAVAVQGDEIKVTPKLRDRLLEDDERVANWLKLWSDGAARGDNRALSPARPPDPLKSGERLLTETWQLPGTGGVE